MVDKDAPYSYTRIKYGMPKYWVPTLFLLEGIPFTLVTSVSIIFYKGLNLNNTLITLFASLFTIPYFLKPLMAPLFENLTSKRMIILSMSWVMFFLAIMLSLSLSMMHYFYFSIAIFLLIAFASSILDMNADGLYIICLTKRDQAFFIGIRTISYQLGRLFCEGGLVMFAGLFFSTLGVRRGWQLAFIVLALYFFITTLYHRITLPIDKKQEKIVSLKNNFRELYTEFIQLPNLKYALMFIFIYQFAAFQLVKIVPLFLLDPHGLALTTTEVGLLYGVIGTISMLLGILLSGILLTNKPMRHFFIPITIFASITNIGYVILLSTHNFYLIALFIALAQFGYGLINGVYMLYLLHSFGVGKYPMSLYAIGTALMGLSIVIIGGASGYLQHLLGYNGFFIWIMIISVIIIILAIYVQKRDIVIAKTNID